MTQKIEINKKVLEDLYLNKKISTYKIAQKFNCDPSVIQKRLKEHNIKTRNPKKKISISRDKLHDLYIKQGLSVTNTARQLGISHCAIYYKLKENGITIRKKNFLDIKKEELYRLYIKENLSPKVIAKKFHSNKTMVFERLKRYGIKTKSLSEANTKYKKERFDGDDQLKAYMIGFRLGDLNVKAKKGASIFIKSNTTKEDQLNLIKKFMGIMGIFGSKDMATYIALKLF